MLTLSAGVRNTFTGLPGGTADGAAADRDPRVRCFAAVHAAVDRLLADRGDPDLVRLLIAAIDRRRCADENDDTEVLGHPQPAWRPREIPYLQAALRQQHAEVRDGFGSSSNNESTGGSAYPRGNLVSGLIWR